MQAAANPGDNPNGVWYDATDGKLHWTCSTTGTLTYHKEDNTTLSYTNFNRYYCEAYVADTESSTNITSSNKITSTGGDLNVGANSQNSYCSSVTTDPWIQINQWLEKCNNALPQGNLWIKVSACNASNQLGNVIFWINAGAVDQYLPKTEIYVSSNGDDTNGDGTKEKPFATLKKAQEAIKNTNANYVVYIMDDLTVSQGLSASGCNLTVTTAPGVEKTATIHRDSSGSALIGSVARIDANKNPIPGAKITLKNIILDGAEVETKNSLLLATGDGAELTLGEGAVLQNAKGTGGVGGVCVINTSATSATSPKLVIDGGVIQNCGASGEITLSSKGTSSASAVLVYNGQFEMKSGKITNNKGTVFGAVTLLGTTYQTSVMSGGEITDNISINTVGSGGGIMLTSSGQLTLTGGKITGNTGYYSSTNALGAGGITVWKDTNDKLYLGQPETSVIIKDNKTTTATTVAGAESDTAKKDGNLCMTGSHLMVQAPPVAGSEIGISAPLNTDFATADSATVAQNSVGAFFSDQGDGATVQVNGSNLQLAGVTKIYVSSTGDGSKDSPYLTLQQAYQNASPTGVTYIYVKDDLTVEKEVRLSGKNVVIASDPEAINPVSIKNNQTDVHLFVISAGNVTFQNIILDGQKKTIIPSTVGTTTSNTHALLYIEGGTVTLEKGAILKNNNGGYNYNLTNGTAGAALIKGGTLNMKDKAEISECEATRFGGAVLVWGGAFNMSGGSITGNCTKSPGASGVWTEPLGGAVCIYSGTMTMTGGSITGNSISGEVKEGESLSGAGVLLTKTGAFNLSGDVNITNNTYGGQSNVSLNSDKTITIPTGKSMGENAQVGVYTLKAPANGTNGSGDVKFTTGGSEADKTHFTSDNASAAGVVFKNNALWLSVDARSAATGSVDAMTGEGFITFDGNSSFKYAVRIPGTPPTIPEGVKAYGADGAEITADTNGWFQPATTGKITFKPLPVGVALEIVSVPSGDSATTPESTTSKTDAVVPAVSLDQLAAQVDKTKVNLTIDRATTNTSYALVDASGNVVKFDANGAADSNGSVTWIAADTNGKAVFKGLEPNTKYTVVAAKTGAAMPDEAAIKALAANKKVVVDVATPSVKFKDIDPKNVANYLSGSDDGKSTITVYPTAKGQQYAVIDKDGAVSVWQTADASGGILTFEAETAKQSYKIVTQESENIIPGSRVPVPDATAGDTKIIIKDDSITDLKKSGKVYSYKLGNAMLTGKGANTFEIGVDAGYFTVDAAPPVGCNFYASLTANGSLATSRSNGSLRVGAAYTYLQFKCPGVNTVFLQEYLREHVTFYRAEGVNQTITAVAENVTLPETGNDRTEAFMGHYYQFVSNTSSSWTTAYAGAKGKTFNGLTGYLLTVTNSNEHNYIYQMFGKNGWMAATRSVSDNGSYDGVAFNCGNSLSWDWKWACGPEAGTVIGVQYANRAGMKAASYANWHSGEPNGRNVPGVSAANEGFGQYGYGGYGRWNDLPNQACGGIQGYYVEFGGYNDDNLTIKRGMDARTVADADCANPLTVSGDSSASLTVTSTDVNFKYAVVDEDGTVVNTTDATPWTAGNGAALTFNGLTAGKLYHVVAVPKESNTTDGQGVVGADGILVDWSTLADNTAAIAATAVAPVTPTNVNPVREGGTVKAPEATNADHDYALADKDGNLVTTWTQGATGGLTFNGLNPEETYTLVETGHPDTSKPYAGGAVRLYGADEGKKILPVPAPEDMTGAYQSGTSGTSSITIEPAEAGLTYTATPVSPTTGEPITVTAPADSDDRASAVTFSGLTPGGNYTISVSDGTNTTAGSDIVAPVESAQPERAQTGEGENRKDTVTLPGETTDTDKVYALVDPNGNYINPDGSLSVDEATGQPKPVWFTGTGAADADLTWTNLDPDATYQTLTAPKDGSNNAPVGNAVPSAVTTPASGGDVTASAAINETTGDASITVNPAESGYNYIVVDPDRKAAAIKAGDGNALTFDGLKPGQEYQVVKQSGAQTAPAVGDPISDRGTKVETPVLSEQVKTSITAVVDPINPNKLAMTVKPTSAQVKYAVVDPATGAVVGSWQKGTGENGAALTFSGLDPNKDYKIVASAAQEPGNTVSDIANRPAEDIRTSGAPVAVTRAEDSGNQDKDQLIFTVDSGKSYAVVDDDGAYYSADGSVTTGDPWTPGTGSAVTVTGLDPTKTYTILVKDSNASNAISTATVSKPSGNLTIPDNAVTARVDAEGVASITVTPTVSGKRYVVVDKDNIVVATGTGDGDALTFSGDPITTDNIPDILPGQTYTVTMVGEDASVNVGDHQTPDRGAKVTVPVAGENGITTREDLEHNGKYIIAVKPTNPGVDYVLVNPDGVKVVQQTGKENNGSVVFDNLDPNTTYHVVTVPKGTEYTQTAPNQPGITTPADITVPIANQVSKTDNTVTVNPTVLGQSYNLLDREGNLVKNPWIPGNGGSITFDGLTTGQTYIVVVRLNDVDSATEGDQPSDTVTGSAVTPTVDGSSNDVTVTPDNPVKIPEVGTVTQDEENKVTVKPDDGGGTITIKPKNTDDKITVNGGNGAITVPSGGTATIKDDNGDEIATIDILENSVIKPNGDGKVEVPTGSKVTPKGTDSEGKQKQPFTVIKGTGVVKMDGTVTSPIDQITKVQYEDETTTEISETDGGVVSQVEVKPNTPTTTANHKALQELAKENQTSGQSVTVKLTVEKKNEEEDTIEGKDEIDAIKNQAVESLDYLDMTLIKTTTTGAGNTTTTPLPETGETLLEIEVNFNLGNKKNVTMFRYHKESGVSAAQILTQITDTNDKRDGAFRLDVDNNLIYIYSNKFSTYAIGYTETTSTEPGGNPGDGSGGSGGGSSGGSGGGSSSGSGAASPTVKVDNSEGGTVTLSSNTPKPGDKVTVTVKPDEGKAVSKITVTDKKGNVLEVVDNKDGAYTYTQPEQALSPVTVKVEYKTVTDDPVSNSVSKLLTTDKHIVYMNGDDNGLFRPLANMTRAEAAQVFYNLLRDKNVTAGSAFTDVPADAWYAQAVQALSGLRIINGVGDQRFAPERSITRAEFVAIASRFVDQTVSGSSGGAFPDVSESYWAYGLIGQAVSYGWVNGYDDGNFYPDKQIKRSEVAKIVNVMLARSGDKSYIDAHSEQLRLFSDVKQDYWAYYDIVEASNAHEFSKSGSKESWNS